ncbi:MAG: hypothetical protein ACKV0T_19330, partial [Planctomycetales bacterium]
QAGGVDIVGITHLNKSSSQQPQYRAMGSLAFQAVARTVLGITRDPEDPERRLLTSIKNNLSAEPPTLAFRPAQDRIEYEPGIFDATWNSALKLRDKLVNSPALAVAVEYLLDILADGERPSKEVERLAGERGIAPMTLERARQNLKIEFDRRKKPNGKEFYVVFLPEGAPTLASLRALRGYQPAKPVTEPVTEQVMEQMTDHVTDHMADHMADQANGVALAHRSTDSPAPEQQPNHMADRMMEPMTNPVREHVKNHVTDHTTEQTTDHVTDQANGVASAHRSTDSPAPEQQPNHVADRMTEPMTNQVREHVTDHTTEQTTDHLTDQANGVALAHRSSGNPAADKHPKPPTTHDADHVSNPGAEQLDNQTPNSHTSTKEDQALPRSGSTQ